MKTKKLTAAEIAILQARLDELAPQLAAAEKAAETTGDRSPCWHLEVIVADIRRALRKAK